MSKPVCSMFKSTLRAGFAGAASLACLLTGTLPADAQPSVMSETITVGEVKAAQDGWCDALVAISTAHAEGGLAKSKPLSSDIIDAAYAYQFGPVAFKPTWAYGDITFRTTKDGALSYFIGDDPNYNDPGFGIGSPGDGNYPDLSNRSPWVKCTPEIFAVQVFGNTANAMGWVHFEAADGTTSKVDKTFSYIRDDDGNLRITVHHSSSPYSW
ncbi:MAG: hypothetical protein VXZ59_02925 [Cyanobacteriota bacterium]|nr:hypothetical protein [Cyanobacteriota bacterium]